MRKTYIILTMAILILAPLAFWGGLFATEKIHKNFFESSETLIVNKAEESTAFKSETAEDIYQKEIAEPPRREDATEIKPPQTDENLNVGATNPAVVAEEDKFKFGIVGDTQYANPADPNSPMRVAIKNIINQNVEAIMTMGDQVSSCDVGCENKLTQWKNAFGLMANKVYPTIGNHDYTGGDKAGSAWRAIFNLPTNGPAGFSEIVYSFDIKNSHFIVLASDAPKENKVNKIQRDWLEQDLAKNKKENVFVFFHEPAFPVSEKIGESLDVNNKDRNDLWDILVRYKVTGVFNGHEHLISRKNARGIYQFVFGNTNSASHDMPKAGLAEYAYRGTHYGIVEVDGKTIKVNSYAVTGGLLNSFTIPR